MPVTFLYRSEPAEILRSHAHPTADDMDVDAAAVAGTITSYVTAPVAAYERRPGMPAVSIR